jgi:hypothetical protein
VIKAKVEHVETNQPASEKGKLDKKDVQNLPDDVDEIAKTVYSMNFKE